jgi:hypothetical protein
MLNSKLASFKFSSISKYHIGVSSVYGLGCGKGLGILEYAWIVHAITYGTRPCILYRTTNLPRILRNIKHTQTPAVVDV